MKILGLPGKNDTTGPWMDEIVKGVAASDDEWRVQYYECWKTADAELDEMLELDRASEFAPDLIVAKSLGTLVTIEGIARGLLTPSHCVLIGMPLAGISEQDRVVLSGWHDRQLPTLFIQQTSDPAGTFRQITQLVREAKHCTFTEVAGNDHMYGDVDELVAHINRWRASDT